MSADLLEQWQVNFTVLLESRTDPIADVHRIYGATDDVGRQIHAWRAIDGNAGDNVGCLQTRAPFLIVDRERVHGAGARHRFGDHILRKTLPAHRAGRMDEGRARLTAQQAQYSVRSASPEEAVLGIQPRQDPGRTHFGAVLTRS